MGALGAQKRGLGALLLKDEKWTKMARCTFFEGRYFLGHPKTPRPISKDAGTVPAHFDLGFIGQLSKLTFRPTTVDVHLGLCMQNQQRPELRSGVQNGRNLA